MNNPLSTERCCIPFSSEEEVSNVIDMLKFAGCWHSGDLSLEQAYSKLNGKVFGLSTSQNGTCTFYTEKSFIETTSLLTVEPFLLTPEIIEDYRARVEYGCEGYREYLVRLKVNKDF